MIKKALLVSTLVVVLAVGGGGLSAGAPDPGLVPQAPPGWQQANTNGFGDANAVEVTALEEFNGYLYAGTDNALAGARIFRSPDGTTWTPVTDPGFGEPHDIRAQAILDLAVFGGALFAATGRGGNVGQIWRSVNGLIWAPMVIHGFSNPDTRSVTALTAYDGMLYAGAANSVTGAQIWRSYTGGNNTWEQVAPATPGTVSGSVTGFTIFGDAIYAAVESEEGPAHIWRSIGGQDWATVVADGFGDSKTSSTGGMAEFGGYLYAGAGNVTSGAQLWRTLDGAKWEQATTAGFDDPNNRKVEAVFVFENRLYAGVRNTLTGMEVWRSSNGTTWEQVNTDGFGDPANPGTNRNHATGSFLGRLYVGTANSAAGGELWRMQQQQQRNYLPVISR